MKDNFDLKKYLKDNEVMEKSNKYVAATLKEDKKVEEKKPLKEGKDALREKIKNMVMAEMADMEDSMEEGYGKYEEDNVDEASCGYEEDGMGEAMSKKKKSLDDGIKTADKYMNEAEDNSLKVTFTSEYLNNIKTNPSFYSEKGLADGFGMIGGKKVKEIVGYIDGEYEGVIGFISGENIEGVADDELDTVFYKALNINETKSLDEAEDEETEEEEVEVVDTEDMPEEGEEVVADTGGIMGNLEAAIEKARELGDEKLIDQLGNTITFYTRQHISK